MSNPANEVAWPFDQATELRRTDHVASLGGVEPIMLVGHDADDHGWQFIGTSDGTVEDGRVICLAEIVTLDPAFLIWPICRQAGRPYEMASASRGAGKRASDAKIRERAARVCVCMVPDGKDAITELERVANEDPDESVRRAALDALEKIGR